MAGLHVLGDFFWVNFSEILKHEVQGISGRVQWLKKPMLAYGKNMPKNNQFSVLCKEKVKNTCPKLRNFYLDKKIYPIHAVQPMLYIFTVNFTMSRFFFWNILELHFGEK